MASEIKYAVQQFEWPTTTGTFDVTITSLGWTPKACKVTTLGSSANGTPNVNACFGIGFSDGSTQMSVAIYDKDAESTVLSTRVESESGAVFLNPTTYRLDLLTGTAGPISNGWKIDCINSVSPARKCVIEFFGGADLSANVSKMAPSSTGSTTKTGISFTPNLLFAVGDGGSYVGGRGDQDIFHYGAAHDNGVSIEQGAILSELGVHGSSSQISTAKLTNNSIAGQLHNGAESWRGSISAFTSDGWTFTVDSGSTGGGDDITFLALDIGDRDASISIVNAPTSAALDWAVTGIGFEPQGLMLIPSMMESADVNAIKTDQKAGYLSVSATDGTRVASHSVTAEDAASTTNISRVSHERTAYLLDTSDTALFDVGLPTFDSDGWTVDAADISTAQATQRKWLAIAIEAEAGITAATTGTAIASITEADIVAGGKTIILTLTGDTWVAAGATFDAQRQAIINGLDSAQSETNGWDAEVKANEVVGAVVRTSSTVVTITLTAAASYDITAQETITATIPAAALVTSATDVVSSPTFTVDIVASGSIAIFRRRIEGQGNAFR